MFREIIYFCGHEILVSFKEKFFCGFLNMFVKTNKHIYITYNL